MAVTLDDIKANVEIKTLIDAANRNLEGMGYTDHGPRHVGYVSRITREILERLGYDARLCELGAIAGWVHDVGNMINRRGHGVIGATLLYRLLSQLGMPISEVCEVCTAVGNHEEETGQSVSVLSAALIIADKIDAHRTRVRRSKYDNKDIHDRVNYAIQKTKLVVDLEGHDIRFEFEMDNSSSIMEFMQIYLRRMVICEGAAEFLGCSFSLIVNQMQINNLSSGAMQLVRDTSSEKRENVVDEWVSMV